MATETLVRDTREQVVPRQYATSGATRLLSAGAYLDPQYRQSVIHELTTNWWRMVVPAYGYDTVSVLAHSLVARRLRRGQTQFVGLVTTLISILVGLHVLSILVVAPAYLWVIWAAAFLRRIATLNMLITYLRPPAPGEAGPDGRYPHDKLLTAELVQKISLEQASGTQGSDQRIVYYGGFDPFVGAGNKLREWSNATLLVEAPANPFAEKVTKIVGASENGNGSAAPHGKRIVPFTSDDIMDLVAERLFADLQQAPDSERVELLTVERCSYGKANGLRPESMGDRDREDQERDLSKIRWHEDYNSTREYLCIRVGSWDQELVTSLFVGFDVKGNTLHSEFYGYALLPIKADYHLVDRLPAAITPKLAVRVAFDVIWSAPGTLIGMARGIVDRVTGGRLSGKGAAGQRKRGRARKLAAAQSDTSQFQLDRYTHKVLDRGALLSIREMAMSADYHHFFQESDADKYWQIVERRILRIVEDFLDDHNVDPADHRRAQTNILNHQDFGQNNDFGSGNNFNQGDNATQSNNRASDDE